MGAGKQTAHDERDHAEDEPSIDRRVGEQSILEHEADHTLAERLGISQPSVVRKLRRHDLRLER